MIRRDFVYIPSPAFISFVNSDCDFPYMSSSIWKLVNTSIIDTHKGGRLERGFKTQDTFDGLPAPTWLLQLTA